MTKLQIEITDNASKVIEYPPNNKEFCDWCLHWMDLDKIDVYEREDGCYEFVCFECLESSREQ